MSKKTAKKPRKLTLGEKFSDTFSRGGISTVAVISAFAFAFITASYVTLLRTHEFETLDFLTDMSVPLFWGILFGAIALSFASRVFYGRDRVIYYELAASTVLFATTLAVSASADIYMNVGIAFVVLVICGFLAKDDKLGLARLSALTPGKKVGWIAVGVMVTMFTIIVTLFTSYKYTTYSNSTFDFGIFAQMFENMRHTGAPFTSVERVGGISHFGVHFSPIYYLVLPGYLLCPFPYYLFFIQALAVGAGAFAVLLICRKLKFSEIFSIVCSAMYLMLPSMANGCFYDFHENKFLSVAILFMMYFVLEEKPIQIFITALATLMIKEDAAVYVAAVALFIIFTRKGKKMKVIGASLLAFAVAYFFFAVNMIEAAGGSAMINRLSDYYTTTDGGVIDVIKTCLYDIGYLIKKTFTATASGAPAADKLMFLIWVFLPLLFVPFFNEKQSTLVLLIPMLVINIMQSWVYQYNIDFQYTYGSVALVFFMLLMAYSGMNPEKRRSLAATSLLLCTVFSLSLFVPKAYTYSKIYNDNTEYYEATTDFLAKYEKDLDKSSVTACFCLVPHLYYVEDLHPCPSDNYPDNVKTEYIVVDTRYPSHNDKLETFKNGEYTKIDSGGFVELYRLTSSIGQ